MNVVIFFLCISEFRGEIYPSVLLRSSFELYFGLGISQVFSQYKLEKYNFSEHRNFLQDRKSDFANS